MSAIDLLFGGMAKLSPGDDAHTLRALRSLPRSRFDVIVDAGCGAGRQTLVVAKELGTRIDAVDTYEAFLDHLAQRAAAAGLAHLVRTHCMDMKDIPAAFARIDLLWCEGAVYNIGFAEGLRTWSKAIAPGGFAVLSELSWLREDPPPAAREFFAEGYPAMQTAERNVQDARDAGYECLETFTLPDEAWVDGYYDVLEPRAQALLDHADASVRAFAAETVREIEVFRQSGGSYGYVFHVLRRL